MASNPIGKCSKWAKHKWSFVKNVKRTTAYFGLCADAVTIAKKGIYRCECGATKFGDFRMADQ